MARSSPRSSAASTTRTPPAPPTSRTARVNYLEHPAVEIGLRLIDDIGIETIHARVAALGAWLLHGLGSLRHRDGSRPRTIYGPASWQRRGATIAFNFLHPDGRVVDERYVDRVAARHKVSLRTGCFCNPAPARWPSRSRARRCSAASSATA